MENTKQLNGKHVIILGGSAGIGLATAIASAAEGAQVTLVSSNSQRLNDALKQLPATAKAATVDLKDETSIQQFFESCGNFDHLIFTAGENLKIGPLNGFDLAEAQDFFKIRYWGAVAAVKYAAGKINPQGSIVLTSGIASVRPPAGFGFGASICAAMEGFTRAMAIELAPVRVNIVSPGLVDTNLWANFSDEDKQGFFEQTANALPVKRIGTAVDIAKAYVYLMTQQYGTGQTLVVDGGNVLV